MTCACGYVFTEGDHRATESSLVYRRTDTGEILTLSEAPIGAMWDCTWFSGTPYHRPGADGVHLCVRTPGGTWEVDGRASNCTRPDDDAHRCWVRHGDVRAGEIHVDKNGDTCSAGAGSILQGGYHGFLHNSHLVQC